MSYQPFHPQQAKLPTFAPYSQNFADCPPGTTRINNHFKECWGVVYMCRDACYDFLRDHYEGIGPWKTCGICIGGPFTPAYQHMLTSANQQNTGTR